MILVFIILTSSLFPAINKPGTLIIAAALGGLIQGAKFNEMVKVLGRTIKQMSKS